MANPDPLVGEGYSQIQTAGSGDKVRAIVRDSFLQEDGYTRVTVIDQVMALSDLDGNILGDTDNPVQVDSPSLEILLTRLIDEVQGLRRDLCKGR